MARFTSVYFFLAALLAGQITIIESGSTNTQGMTVVVERKGNRAVIEAHDGTKRPMKLSKEMASKLAADIKAAGALDQLPVSHCMKSVSFGTSLFVEENGVRSPDLSCQQHDRTAAAIKSDVAEIMRLAKAY